MTISTDGMNPARIMATAAQVCRDIAANDYRPLGLESHAAGAELCARVLDLRADGLSNRDLATELLAVRAKLEAAEKLADALSDFATAKIDALRFPGVIRSPEDEPDPVVDADYVWALQDDAKTALAAWKAA